MTLPMPWCVPVPLRPTPEFAPLRTEHASLAVTTDLAAVGSYGIAGSRHDLIGLADLQTCLDVNAPGRLGSGRAVFFQNTYLKGVGLTPLAANWNDANDVYHGTGHMFPSAAAREFAITALARRMGFEHAIVPCNGVLVRPLDPRLTDVLRCSLEDFYEKNHHRAADESMQAVSAKPGSFARLTNLVWLWNTPIPALPDGYVVAAARLSHAAFSGFAPAADSALSAPAIVAALEAAVARAIDNCFTYLRAGVFWGSFHNNFSADGRFLDIELPTLTGSHVLGAVLLRRDAADVQEFDSLKANVGTELFQYLAEVRLFIRFWENRLRFLSQWGEYLTTAERAFCAGLADGLRDTFSPHSLAFNRELLLGRLVEFFRSGLGLSDVASRSLEQLFRESYAGTFDQEAARTTWRFRRLPLDIPDSEPGLKLELYTPEFLFEALHRPAGELQLAYGEFARGVDGVSRPEPWLDRLRQFESSLQ